jgi:phosphate transport system ATP-binding protein
MSPDELLLEPPHVANGHEQQHHAPGEPAPASAAPVGARAPTVRPEAGAEVPPVRTIVLDRQPEAVRPPHEREAVRASTSTGPERLRLEDVSIDYGAKQAVKSVSLSIHQGEVLALIGPSGCGKTTLLRTLNRLTELTPSASRAGRVLLDGEDVHELADTTLRARVAMVFQQPNPFPMSIFDNVAFALREQSRRRPRRRELEPLVIDALRRAGLYEEVRDELDRPALRLSGGQQQRLCIARAIAPRPEVLLMDEPCSALDPISTSVIEKLIGELRRDLAVVVVTHNLAQAHRVADKVAFMYLGDLVEYGSTSEVFDEPRAPRTRDYVRGAFG